MSYPECGRSWCTAENQCSACQPTPDARPSAQPATHPADLVNVGAATHEYWVPLGRLRRLLATQGLAIVPIAEAPSAEEMRLADVCETMTGDPDCAEGFWDAVYALRDARRAAKGET